ncbi:MAG: hypothetical protein PHI89_04225 [Thiovulaceae bacterium]|jgi:hypothetical protein|nr:hypothetical protein [Sulfurimonadaceae bacterium]MDD3817275.1 hypothetical protein [Sulfurimonadaceae bacterium]
MKVAVECKSPLLQKSLELFLAKYLCTTKHCDIVIRDEKVPGDARSFYISSEKSADLVKPFSKSQLILALENRLKNTSLRASQEDAAQEKTEPLNFDILEKRIEFLTREYQQNIINAVRAFYEK